MYLIVFGEWICKTFESLNLYWQLFTDFSSLCFQLQSGKMENLSSNATFNSSKAEQCLFAPTHIVMLSVIDIFTFIIGEAVVGKLLWIIFTSKKAIDILNCNLAIFHTVHYFTSFVHLIYLFLLPQYQIILLKVLLTYAQTGGASSLVFICMERYIAVVYPTSYHLLNKYKFREMCALTVWLLTAVTVLTSNLINIPSQTAKVLGAIPRFLVLFSFTMMIYYNRNILITLMKSAPEKHELHPAKKRAFLTIRATTFINLSCYIPVIILQMFMYLHQPAYSCSVIPLCITLVSIASLGHPLFYLSTQRKLRLCLKREMKAR